jgi:hypothetical protein
MIIHIVLTLLEQSWAKQWATAIYDASTNMNLVDAKVDSGRDSLELDIVGFSGELAFAKLVNQFPSTDTDGPTPIDCTYNGKTIDVKTTPYTSGKLLSRPEHKGKSAEAFVLLTGTPEDGYIYRGWFLAADLFQDKFLTDLGHGSTYAVPQHLLKQGLPE